MNALGQVGEELMVERLNPVGITTLQYTGMLYKQHMFYPYRTESFSIAVNVRHMELLYESFYSLSANKLVTTGCVVVHVASRGRVAICVDSLQKHQCITNK